MNRYFLQALRLAAFLGVLAAIGAFVWVDKGGDRLSIAISGAAMAVTFVSVTLNLKQQP